MKNQFSKNFNILDWNQSFFQNMQFASWMRLLLILQQQRNLASNNLILTLTINSASCFHFVMLCKNISKVVFSTFGEGSGERKIEIKTNGFRLLGDDDIEAWCNVSIFLPQKILIPLFMLLHQGSRLSYPKVYNQDLPIKSWKKIFRYFSLDFGDNVFCTSVMNILSQSE